MPAKLLFRNRVDATGFEYDGTLDGTASPPAVHPLIRPLLTGRAAPPSILPRRSADKRARLLRPAFTENLEAVLLVLVNSEDEVQTVNCMRRPNADEIEAGQAGQMEELIEADYVPIGLLVLPPSDRINDYVDASGVLRWPAETWESCRSVEERKGFIAHVAEGLIPGFHLRHVPNGIDRSPEKHCGQDRLTV
jgi:hypothetical protein